MRKSIITGDINMIDLHAHILPGLDDGAKTLQESIEMVRQLSNAGFTTVVATPHVIEGRDALSPQVILEETANLQEAILGEGIKMKILPGAENYVFPEMAAWLKRGRLMTLGNTGKYLLFELPMFDIPHYTDKVLFDLQVAGVTPIVAHPERNKELVEDEGRILEWANKGVLFQLNLRSLSGRYGPNAQQFGKRLIESGLIHGIGTDIHHVSQSENAFRGELAQIKERMTLNDYEEIIADYPGKIVAGKQLPVKENYQLKKQVKLTLRQKAWGLLRK